MLIETKPYYVCMTHAKYFIICQNKADREMTEATARGAAKCYGIIKAMGVGERKANNGMRDESTIAQQLLTPT